MTIKNFFGKVAEKLHIKKSSSQPNSNHSDYFYEQAETRNTQGVKKQDSKQEEKSSSGTFSNIIPKRRNPSLEKLKEIQEGFEDMSEHLNGIEKNLQNFPSFVENQKQFNNQLLEYLQKIAEKDQQLLETMQDLPKKTAKENRKTVWLVIIVGLAATIAFAIFQAVVLG